VQPPQPSNGTSAAASSPAPVLVDNRIALGEDAFHSMIAVERKRTERSRRPILLTLIDTGNCLSTQKNGKLLQKILTVLSAGTRETDIRGWYKDNCVIGVMFTEIPTELKQSIVSTMLTRVSSTLRDNLSAEQFSNINISCHLFPDEWDHELSRRPSNPTLYPDLSRREQGNKLSAAAKRGMDIAGSLLALMLLSPLFLFISVAIKFTSNGPVFFRQERVGRYGRPFVFLKFRSMHADNDSTVHKEWFARYVVGQEKQRPSKRTGVYKMTDDPRITPFGRFLRRSSLDELPQFINVLKGEMSLVGPRPPIPYEVDAYQIWHRSRILEAKPGITGLWQVTARSRVTFDEMVRLDLRYARSWSLWLDVKILLQTPRAVLLGDGAY